MFDYLDWPEIGGMHDCQEIYVKLIDQLVMEIKVTYLSLQLSLYALFICISVDVHFIICYK